VSSAVSITAAFLACLLISSAALSAEPEPECGVDMPHTTMGLSFDPATIEKFGSFDIDGGLYRQGLIARCIAVHIDCSKEANQCRMVEVGILKLGPYPEIGPITLTDPMRIVEWTKDGLVAAGQTHACQSTQLSVDFTHRKVQLVSTPLCPPGGAPVIEELRTFRMSEPKRS
jgi:hypothetical protein